MLLLTWVFLSLCQVCISDLYDVTTFYYVGKRFSNTEEENMVEVHLRTNAVGLPIENVYNLQALSMNDNLINWKNKGWGVSLSKTTILKDEELLKDMTVDTTFFPLVGFSKIIPLKLNGYIDYGNIYFVLTPVNKLLRNMDFFYFFDIQIGQFLEGYYYKKFSLSSLSIERCEASSEMNRSITDIDDVEFFANCTTMLNAYETKWDFQRMSNNNYLRIDTSNKVIRLWDNEEFKFPYEAWQNRSPIEVATNKDNLDLNYFSIKIGKINGGISGLRTVFQLPTVLSTKGNFQTLSSPWFNSTYSIMCITTVFYAELRPKPKISFFVENKANNLAHLGNVETNKMGWQINRLYATLPKDFDMTEICITLLVTSEKEFKLQRIAFTNAEDQEDVFAFRFDSRKLPYIPFDVKLSIKERTTRNREGCQNGGKGVGDVCACPPGFDGELCDQGCGQNYYGMNCDGICSTTNAECKGIVLCVPALGCNCASGYTGVTCEDSCVKGKYGVNCSQNCGQCKDACDIYTGECILCKPGYFPPFCKHTYARLQFGPIVSLITYTKAKVTPNFTKPFLGEGSPLIYQIQYKESVSPMWKIYSNHMFPENISEVSSVTLYRLKSGVQYMVRVVLISDDSYQGDLVPYTNFTTLCLVPHSNNLILNSSTTQTSFSLSWKFINGTEYDCPVKYYEVRWKEAWRTVSRIFTKPKIIVSDRQPGTVFKIKIRAYTVNGTTPFSKTNEVVLKYPKPGPVRNLHVIEIGNNSAQIIWEKPVNMENFNINYTVIYKCVERLVCGIPCNYSFGKLIAIGNSVTLNSLLPASLYYVTVAANTQSERRLRFITNFSAPTEIPVLDRSRPPIKKSTEITVFLKPQKVCSGFFKGYFYQVYEVNDRSTVISQGKVNNSEEITVTNLQPSTDYVLLVHVITSKTISEKFMEYYVSATNNSVTGIANLTVVNTTYSSFYLQWDYKTERAVPGLTFLVIVKEVRMFNSDKCCPIYAEIESNTSSPSPYAFEALNLNPASKYNVTIWELSVNNGSVEEISICTKPPPLPVLHFPNVVINTNDSWRWLTQNQNQDYSKRSKMYSSLIVGNLLLVLSKEIKLDPGITEENILQQLRTLTDDNFYFAAEYHSNETIKLGSNNGMMMTTTSRWGRPHNLPLLDNVLYYLAAVQITSFCNTYNFDIVFSSTFMKP